MRDTTRKNKRIYSLILTVQAEIVETIEDKQGNNKAEKTPIIPDQDKS